MPETKKPLSERIKAALLELGISVPVKKVEEPVKLEDVTLIDGTVLNVDSLAVGSKATFTGTDGVSVPAEGEYEAADGSTIVCAAGVITEIKPKEADVQPEPEMDMKAVLSQLAELKSKIAAFDGKFKTQEDEKKAIEVKLEKTETALKSTLEFVDELSKTAAALPLELQKQTPKKEEKFTKKLTDEEYALLSNKDKVIYNRLFN
ncbi:MAG TPA: hypothetical protein PKZ75_15030 [Bacteroidia bacterium]|nr:hypothetical protein [Bacteroidia bacterium]